MENGPFIDDFPIKTTIYRGFSMAMLNNQMVLITAWWFGTWLWFFQILGISSSQLTNSYFSEGWVQTTNQQHVEKRKFILLPICTHVAFRVWQRPTSTLSQSIVALAAVVLVLLPAVYQFKRRGSTAIRRHRLPSSEFFIRHLSSWYHAFGWWQDLKPAW